LRIFKFKNFEKWAKKEDISNEMLIRAVKEIKAGLIDADLGGGLYKKRLARQGQGKRGGYRALLALQRDEKIFFLYGFAKNKQESINFSEQDDFLVLSKYLLSLTDYGITYLININELQEVIYADERKI
jgi:hypothetical protein